MHISYDLEFDLDRFIKEMEERSVRRSSRSVQDTTLLHHSLDSENQDESSATEH